MTRQLFILTVFFTATVATVFGQYLTPDISVIRTNKVKQLTVLNCIDSSDCFMDDFYYNKKGLMIKEVTAIVAFYDEWDYYDNSKLKTYYVKIHSSENNIYRADHYYYDKNWKFKWIISDQYNNQCDKIVSTDTTFKEPEAKKAKKADGTRNKKGQIIEQELGDLYFPCGIIFKGKHKIHYEYLNNGLLQNAKVYDDSGKLIISFTYNYNYF